MKITSLRLANSIKVGPMEATFLNERDFDMEVFNAIDIRVQHRKTGQVTWTSKFNAAFWTQAEPKAETATPTDDELESAMTNAEKASSKGKGKRGGEG